MEIFTGQRGYNYCIVPLRSPQKGGRHAVTNCERFKRMGIETSGLSKSLQILQNFFTSRVSQQVPAYVSWKLDPSSKGRDTFQMCCTHKKEYDFPPFSLTGRVLHKVLKDQVTLVLETPA